MSRRPRPTRLALACLVALLLLASSVQAKTKRRFEIAYDHFWSAAVRFVRVDQDMEIVDKDKDVGYIIFRFVRDGEKDKTKTKRGALEVVSHDERWVNVQLTLEDQPAYQESLLLSGLAAKLHGEGR